MAAPTIALNNGRKIPALGLGTYLSHSGECARAVKHAISVGYRHFDCAWFYGNEKEVGDGIREAIKEGLVKREDLFVVTKLWCTFHERDQVVPSCKVSLQNLGLDYLDLYLIHWPVAMTNTGKFNASEPFKDAVCYDHDFVETWHGMEECVELGLAKSIGLSNFNSKQILRILKAAKIRPVCNQVEVSPLINQKKLIAFCKERGIQVVAYSPFSAPARPWKKPGDPELSLDDPKLIEIGKKYGKTSGQVVLRYIHQLGAIPIPKSSNPDRIKKNIEIFDFELSPEDVKILDAYNCNERVVPALEFLSSKEYPFNEEF
ncbi:aldo-keto reductase family 1 member B1-like [Cylas formicarius]|uniref:aldo-keto reductase family 1 member B1-like n=1 Tax=Cylas formicarius TaxID=197179 RepID=UPI002958C450|nr:aldo-keto reductase family 1 member B1-like [Cylas formicarius]